MDAKVRRKSCTDDLVKLGLRLKENDHQSDVRLPAATPKNSLITSTFSDVEALKCRLEKEKRFGSLWRSKIYSDYLFPSSAAAAVTDDASPAASQSEQYDGLYNALPRFQNSTGSQSLNNFLADEKYFGESKKNFNSLNMRSPAGYLRRNGPRNDISRLFSASSDRISERERENGQAPRPSYVARHSSFVGTGSDISSSSSHANDALHQLSVQERGFGVTPTRQNVSRRNLLRKHNSVSDIAESTRLFRGNRTADSEFQNSESTDSEYHQEMGSRFSEKPVNPTSSFKIPSFQEFKRMQKETHKRSSRDSAIPEEDISNLTLADQNACISQTFSNYSSSKAIGMLENVSTNMSSSHSFNSLRHSSKQSDGFLELEINERSKVGKTNANLPGEFSMVELQYGESGRREDFKTQSLSNFDGSKDNGTVNVIVDKTETENFSDSNDQSPEMEVVELSLNSPEEEDFSAPRNTETLNEVDDDDDDDDDDGALLTEHALPVEVSGNSVLRDAISFTAKPNSDVDVVENHQVPTEKNAEEMKEEKEEEEKEEEKEDEEEDDGDDDEEEEQEEEVTKKENEDSNLNYNPDIWNFLGTADVEQPESKLSDDVKLNERLQCTVCGVDVATGGDGTLSDSSATWCERCASKNEEHRRAIQEIIDTEISYGKDLEVIKQEFYLPLKENCLLTEDQLQTIFLNLDELIMINRYLVERLESGIRQHRERGNEKELTADVVHVFLDSANMLMAFEAYCINQSGAPVLLDQVLQEKELLRVFLEESQKENPVLRKMDLKSFLIVPVQRVMKYPLLLDRLRRVTPSSYFQQQDNIVVAKRMMEETLTHINSKTIGSVKMKRRSSATPWPGKKNFSLENMELTQLALELLGWNRYVTYFVMVGRLSCSQLVSPKWVQQLNNLKYQQVHCVIATLGMAPNYKNESIISFPQSSTLRSAALVIIKERAGKHSPLRDPILLDRCVVARDPEAMSVFEVIEMNKDSYLLKADDAKETEAWYWQLRMVVKDLGLWRRRRNALANVVTHKRDSVAQRKYCAQPTTTINNTAAVNNTSS